MLLRYQYKDWKQSQHWASQSVCCLSVAILLHKLVSSLISWYPDTRHRTGPQQGSINQLVISVTHGSKIFGSIIILYFSLTKFPDLLQVLVLINGFVFLWECYQTSVHHWSLICSATGASSLPILTPTTKVAATRYRTDNITGIFWNI